MNNFELRSILLNVHCRLTVHDQQRLHFYLKDGVTREHVDDSTLNGTLKLFDSLFDQAKTTEQNLTLLINVFKQISRFDVVQLLEITSTFLKLYHCRIHLDYQRGINQNDLNRSTQNTDSIINQLFKDQETDTDSMRNHFY
jgi:hypothetical protein